MELEYLFKKVDSELKIDFYNRLCIKDPLSNTYSDNVVPVTKSEYMDSVVEELNKMFEEYKYSYYIEYDTSIIHGVYIPSYTIKQDNINIKIEYEDSPKCAYYILKITDEKRQEVDKNSFFYKTAQFRDDEYKCDFIRAKKETLDYIEDVKDSFNWEMKKYEKSDIRI